MKRLLTIAVLAAAGYGIYRLLLKTGELLEWGDRHYPDEHTEV